MKNLFKFVIVAFLLSVNMMVLKADCESDKEAAKNVTYDSSPLLEDGIVNISNNIYGVKENMYITVYDSYTKDTITYHYGDEDFLEGILFFQTLDVNDKIEYTINVYSDQCEKDEVLNTIKYSLDKVNKYAFSEYCNEEFYKSDLCNVYEDTSKMSEKEFKDNLKQDIKKYDLKDNISSTIKKYYLFVLIPVVVIIIFFVVRIIILKKKAKKQNA